MLKIESTDSLEGQNDIFTEKPRNIDISAKKIGWEL